MEDIGCHFKFEELNGTRYHNTILLLSSGRNCLRYIIRERNIKKIYLPYFLCESLSEVSSLENVEIIYYHVDMNLLPIGVDNMQLDETSYLYFVNYYGVLRSRINEYIDKYKYIIVDNTHDFFDISKHRADTIYNFRKYFGVPDGACIVSSSLQFNEEYKVGKSLEKIIEMVCRDETGEYFHYSTFLEADKHFKNEEIRYMSNFTRNYLSAIDYNNVLKKRLENFKILLSKLQKFNCREISSEDLSYMYPLLTECGIELRNYLREKNVYSMMLWPNILENGANRSEISFAENMVLLPIDQRYSEEEMIYISNIVEDFFSNRKEQKLFRGIKYD